MAKKRVSLTLDEDLVEKIDSEAERRDVNRSQMMEDVVREYFSQRGLDTAVILCGDEEVRTLEMYEGKPVLSHILDSLDSEGFQRVLLLIGQNHEIRERFGSGYRGLSLEYIEEEEPQGTAAALRKVKGRIEKDFAVMNGHVIADVDMQDMLRLHEENGVTATMALTAVQDPSEYGVARLKGSKILGFVEKPESGEEPSRLINAGTYIMSPEIFSMLGETSLEESFENLVDRSELAGYIYGGEWIEIED